MSISLKAFVMGNKIFFILFLMIFLSCDKKEDFGIKSPKEKFLSTEKDRRKCETCKDSLFEKYANEVRNSLGEKDSVLRKKLTIAFQLTNRIHSSLNYGGTFFSHQESRLLAEVEYSVYRKDLFVGDDKNFKKNKKKYLSTWISRIEKIENENVYNEINNSETKNRAQDFENKLDSLHRNITNQFVLDEVKRFDSEYY